jgi:hypothetical protein
VHRASWPDVSEIADLTGAAQPADLAAVHQASEITAGLRQERSSRKLGFGVPVRATLSLPREYEPHWPGIQRDILAGNNVIAADVSFVNGPLRVTIEPQTADA